MFSTLKDLFSALSRLTTSINTSADLFDAANAQLAERIGVDHEERPALGNVPLNGRRKVAANKE